MSPFRVVTKVFNVINICKASLHPEDLLPPEESCSRTARGASKGSPSLFCFHGQLCDPPLSGDLEETRQDGCPVRLRFTGSLVIPPVPHLLFYDGNLTRWWWKLPRCLKAKIPFWKGKPSWVNIEITWCVRRRVLISVIISRVKLLIQFQTISELNVPNYSPYAIIWCCTVESDPHS